MDGADNKEVFQCLHGICQDVPGYRLDKILGDLRAIGFKTGPLSKIDALIGDAVRSKSVDADLRLDIRETSAGRKVDEQHTALVVETEAVGEDGALISRDQDSGRQVQVVPGDGEIHPEE